MGKGNTVSRGSLRDQAIAGAAAYKLHEDWGSTPAAIDTALRAAEEMGLQVTLHSDSLNEAGYLESTLRAIDGRSIHAFHAEGAGGGHAPDIMKICGQPHVIPGSTNPTLPHTVNTVAEHLDMLIVCHHLNPTVPGGPRVRRVADPRDDHRGRGRPARHGRHLDHVVGRAGDGPDRRGHHAAPGRSRTS